MCVSNSRLVSSGNPDTEVWETTKAQFVIQENTTKTTTENLATPFEEISKENLRADSKGNTLENSKNDLTENPRENMKISGNTSILESLKSNMPKKQFYSNYHRYC